MFDAFLFIGLPYIAIVTCIAGSIIRYRSHKYSYSALSSQFLESKSLRWGSVSWHIGLLFLFLIHVLPFLFPSTWAQLVSNKTALVVVESVGLASAILALVGLLVLLFRRLINPYIQAVTTKMDLVILALFLVQIVLGIVTAATVRWGAQWATGTTTPYLWSLITFNPDPSYVVEMPPVVKAHIAIAWVIILLIPFSRLVHIFSLPVAYLFRLPQKVVWNTPRFAQVTAPNAPAVASRRHFLKGMTGMAAGGTLLSVGVLEKTVGFYRGPELTPEEKAAQLEENLKRLEMTAEEKKYELERLRNDFILVASMAELNDKTGKYFIDYQMRPALAFKNPDGLPLLISAKCTHLGCTVQADMSDEGKVLCPCHVSWFDVQTGVPDANSPATIPLPILGWVVMDSSNNIIASKEPGKPPTGSITPEQANTCSVYISREHAQL